VSFVTPKKVIFVVGVTALSTDSSEPQDINDSQGRGSLMFKKDWKRAYRQFPICPGDLQLVGFNWNGYAFADRVLPFKQP
jgi:hypothetical protein